MWVNPDTFSNKQLEAYLNTDNRLVLLEGSVSSGKTFISLFMFVRGIAMCKDAERPGAIVIIGKTERTIYRNIITPLIDLLGRKHVRYVRGVGQLYIFGSEVLIIGANDERAEGNIRGMTIALALGDEVTLWPESVFKMLLSRLRVPGARGIFTTNPDTPFHYIKREYIDKGVDSKVEDPIDIKVYHFTLEDNITLTQQYVEAIQREYTGVWFRRFIKGEWCMAQGQIYEQFNESVNVFPNDHVPNLNLTICQHPQFREFLPRTAYFSSDYGTGTVTVFSLWWQCTNGKHLLMREWRYDASPRSDSRQPLPQRTDAEFSQNLYDWLLSCQQDGLIATGVNVKLLTGYVDPSAASFIQQLYRDGFSHVVQANNNVLDGIRTCGSGFTSRKLLIHSSCKGLLEEIPNYVWDERAQEKGEDRPLKKHDHSLDSMRYGYYSVLVPRKGGSKLIGPGKR